MYGHGNGHACWTQDDVAAFYRNNGGQVEEEDADEALAFAESDSDLEDGSGVDEEGMGGGFWLCAHVTFVGGGGGENIDTGLVCLWQTYVICL